jgi:hypothetical protein
MAGLLLWAGTMAIILPGYDPPLITDVGMGAMCCFGLVAVLGIIMGIVGIILEVSNREVD